MNSGGSYIVDKDGNKTKVEGTESHPDGDRARDSKGAELRKIDAQAKTEKKAVEVAKAAAKAKTEPKSTSSKKGEKA